MIGHEDRTMINRLALIALALCAWVAAAHADTAPPKRIVSINLCADELLMALADPGQIVALSPYATDPGLSFMAEQAKAFRHDAAAAETVVGLKPDLVLGGRYTKRATRDMLKRLGYRLVEIDAADSIPASIAQIRVVAALVGHPERGEALVAQIQAAVQAAETAASRRITMPTAVFFQRRGYTTGGDTLTSGLLALTGIINAGAAIAGKTGGFVRLERIVASHPDFLVVAESRQAAEDQGTALLAHPALATLYPPSRRIILPSALTVCGGPSLPAAISWLSRQAARIATVPTH
jgi:iron complex transport system substrate-binding protein